MRISNTSERLKAIIKERNIAQVDILQAAKPYCIQYGVKLGKSDLSQYVNGKVEPKQEKLTILGLALGVNEAWLMGYDVSPVRDNFTVTRSSIPAASNIIPMPEKRQVPLLGTIACGEPILATENIEDYVAIPKELPGDFALTCKGDSMINARIFDGDIVYIRQQDTVENGEIAAVLIDNEATLKRVRFLPQGMLMLQAENPKYPPIYIGGDDETRNVRILGKAVAFQSDIR